MKKSKLIDKNDLCYVEEEEIEENGICDFVPGNPIAQFTFENNTVPSNEPMIKDQSAKMPPVVSLNDNSDLDLIDSRTLKSQSNGITPPIDGEYFVIKRGFTFRRSTVRKLNELKAAHPDENMYLSSIVDKALCHYHDYIFNKNGS